MAIDCKIDLKGSREYEKDKARFRIYPIDNYPAWSLQLPHVAQLSTEHHFLRVPLLGQHVLDSNLDIKEEEVNCGRTSASMIYNWFVLLQGGDPRSAYVSHSRHGNASWPFEIRLPNGYPAFRLKVREDESGRTALRSNNTHDPEGQKSYRGPIPVPLSQCYPGSGDAKELDRTGVRGILGYSSPEYMLNLEHSDAAAMGARRQAAEGIANDEKLLAKTLKSLLDSLRKNNPVIFRGSVTRSQIHFTCFAGYCYLRDTDKPDDPHLWLLVANPSTTRLEVKKALNWENLAGKFTDWKGPTSSTSLIELTPGVWNDGQASLNLFRASTFFRAKPGAPALPPHSLKHALWMDYWNDKTYNAGGRYLVRDVMTEVPDEVVLSSLRGTKYPCPLDGPTGTANLWRHYLNTERTDNGVGGFYVLGLRRNLHGGVHLFAEGEKNADTKVRALAPGFVVAARLPAQDSEVMQGPVKHHLATWPGFVLLRHELRELEEPTPGKDQKGGAKQDSKPPRVGGFYSLYMHLASPATLVRGSGKAHAALERGDKYVAEIPWFKSLFERRFGAFVKVLEDPRKATGPTDDQPSLPLGSLVRSAEEVELDGNGSPVKPSYQVHGELGTIEVKAKDGALRWLYKPAPARLVQATDALADGKVVTFAEPFLPVRAGEFVGWIRPAPEVKKPRSVGATGEDSGGEPVHELRDIPSGFLHWQVFAPTDGLGGDVKNGIQLVLDLVKEIDAKKRDPSLPKPDAPKDVEIADDGDDNFLDLAELEGKLKSALSQEDGQKFAAAFEELDKKSLAEFGYAGEVVGILDSTTSFAPKPEKPIWEAGCKYGYPITLQLSPEYLPPPDQHAQAKAQGAYSFGLQFKKLVGTQLVPIQCGRDCNQAECGKPGSGSREGGAHPPECKPPPLKIDTAAFKAAAKPAKSGAGKDDAAKGETLLSFVLRVPADADQVTLTPGDGLVAGAGDAPLGADLMLLSAATRERWRGTKLRQLSEWSVKGFDALAKKVESVIPIPKEARALAWLDPEKEVPIARQTLSVSEAGLPVSPEEWKGLFDPGEGALKFDGKIDNLHPVTAAWALNILDRYGKATVRSDWAAQTFRKEDPAPLIARWLPPSTGLRLGDTVQALVIDDDFGYDRTNQVRLLAEKDGTKLELATCGYGAGGVIAHPVTNVCFWGDGWKLTTDPAEKGGPDLFGKKTLDVPTLEFAGLSEEDIDAAWNKPHPLGNRLLRWCVKVTGTPPSFIEGVVSVLVRKAGEKSWPAETEDVMLPAHASAADGPDDKDDKDAPLNREVLQIEDGFIIGIDETRAKPDIEIAKGLTWAQVQATSADVRIACSLIDALQTLRSRLQAGPRLTVTEIALDGLSLQVRPLEVTRPPSAKAKAGATRASAADKLLKAARPLPDSIHGLHVQELPGEDGTTLAGVSLSIDEGSLQAADLCKQLRKHLAELRLDPTGCFLLGSLGPRVTEDLEIRHLATAWAGVQEVRVSEVLVKVLHRLFVKAKGVTLSHLADDGYTCWLGGSEKALREAEGLAGSDWRVLCAARDGHLLKVAIFPEPEKMLAVQVDSTPLLEHLEHSSNVEPGKMVEYCFKFETLNGIHLLSGPACPLHGGPVERALFEELATKSPERLAYGPSGIAGQFCRMGFGTKPAVQWVNRGGLQYVELEVDLLGPPSAWKGYTLRLHHGPASGSLDPAPKQDKRISSETRCRFAVLVNPKDSAFQGPSQSHKFRIEAIPPKHVTSTPDPVELEFDCTPRWTDDEPQCEVSSDGKRLEIRCQAAGVEIPAFTNKQATPRGQARTFELLVTDATGNKIDAEKRYKVPRSAGGGHLDDSGCFRASLLLSRLTPDGGTYQIVVRPLERIRDVDLGERRVTYTPEGAGSPPIPSANLSGKMGEVEP